MRRQVLIALMLGSTVAIAKEKPKSPDAALQEYVEQYSRSAGISQSPLTNGGLFNAQSQFVELAADPKARNVGDPVTIQIVESTISSATGSVKTSRNFDTTTGISGLAGKIKTAGIEDLFSGNTTTTLNGSGQTATTAKVQTTLGGQIAAVLPNGNLVIEAQRSVMFSSEHQSVTIRGIVRPVDIQADNSIVSTHLSNLQLEVKGKGIISDNTRQPNVVARWILKLVGF